MKRFQIDRNIMTLLQPCEQNRIVLPQRDRMRYLLVFLKTSDCSSSYRLVSCFQSIGFIK
ncbi:uncharacterized protein PHALS_15349 [Plasmopara halstedii]|uniref:Uncharacterized protein n=1 Tax=Plasmopara halstedii TaxID=4781 RepID=A0A0N7L4K9_PLAHL|nr:uncharacterized protein PHALS_15349 [Plasmopara halstedii]CEG38963.1 hypothetical protein PHALS_15349 [Plasmopara halstedii]|eukprot:XP_024575332.1 hypothetical protein PHALS_15349 [Plasmopara halstedii]